MANPARGGLQPPAPGHRRTREGYAGPPIPPSNNFSAHPSPQHHASGTPIEPISHSVFGSAGYPPKISPRSPTFQNNVPAQVNKRDPVKGNGGSLSELPLGSSTATMREGTGATPEISEQSASLMSNEVIAGMLVSTPYLISSLLINIYSPTHDPRGHVKDESVEFGLIHPPPPRREFLMTCTLVSITMLIIGLYTEMRKKTQLHLLNDPTGKTKSLGAAVLSPRSIFLVMIAIGLPFYATVFLGHGRVSITMLLLLVSRVSPIVQLDHDNDHQKQFRFHLTQRNGTVFFLLGMMVLDTVGVTSSTDWLLILRGYLALMFSVFIIQPPFMNMRKPSSIAHPNQSTYDSSVSDSVRQTQSNFFSASPAALVSTNQYFRGGSILAGFCLLMAIMSGGINIALRSLTSILMVGLFSAISFLSIEPKTFQSKHQIGFIAGSGFSLIVSAIVSPMEFSDLASTCSFTILSYIFVRLDLRTVKSETNDYSHAMHGHQEYHHNHHHSNENSPSRITRWLLKTCEHWPFIYGILKEKDSRKIFYFMWIISIEIVYEAIERLVSGSEVHRIGELLVVSAAGLAVNMVGIMAFDHGHHHGHSHSCGGHDHDTGHLHSHHTNENMHGIFLHILADTLGSVAVVLSTVLVHFYKWSGFDPIASCLIAILIFASAVPLVASTSKTLLLALPADVEYGLRDALAGVSTLRGVAGYSVPKFWLDDIVDHDHKHGHVGHHHHHGHDDHDHNHCHGHHSHTHHQSNIDPSGEQHSLEHTPRHGGTGQRIQGVIHVIASRGADMEDVRRRTISYLSEKGINILVQVEREGENRCWCGGGNKPVT
ncbi:cation efflux protein/zinc transporter [Histoplasma capsulatum var. duboisii H88]|uniref:Zinc transporter n=1 Tax=Ajellomyces capsulatus (strain H88) TaxID=544711 RepID=F0UW92_AJEC8|nr:cation efflux protein/zinc transporter [Histoplasma capsulatum var. duboisii H88]